MSTLFTRPLRSSDLRKLAWALAAGALLYAGALAASAWRNSRPMTPALARELAFDFLRDKSKSRSFVVPLEKNAPADWTTLSNETVRLQARVRLLQSNQTALRVELKAAKPGWLRRTARLDPAPQAAQNATNPPPDPAALRARLAQARLEMQEVSTNLPAALAQLRDARRQLAGAQAEAADALLKTPRDLRRKFVDAASWETLYKTLGQRLWVADQYLSSPEPAARWTGLRLADQLREESLQDAENGWLAARICQGFVLPNLSVADSQLNSDLGRGQLLTSALRTFRIAEETNLVVQTAQRMIEEGGNRLRVDRARLQLARVLEELGDLKGAVTQYRALSNTNGPGRANKRLAMLENRLKYAAPPKN